MRPVTAVRLLRSVEQGGRPARLFGPAAAVRGLSGLHELRRVRVQLAHAEEQLTAARTAVYRDIWTAAA